MLTIEDSQIIKVKFACHTTQSWQVEESYSDQQTGMWKHWWAIYMRFLVLILEWLRVLWNTQPIRVLPSAVQLEGSSLVGVTNRGLWTRTSGSSHHEICNLLFNAHLALALMGVYRREWYRYEWHTRRLLKHCPRPKFVTLGSCPICVGCLPPCAMCSIQSNWHCIVLSCIYSSKGTP